MSTLWLIPAESQALKIKKCKKVDLSKIFFNFSKKILLLKKIFISEPEKLFFFLIKKFFTIFITAADAKNFRMSSSLNHILCGSSEIRKNYAS